jgi:hypothetical protein
MEAAKLPSSSSASVELCFPLNFSSVSLYFEMAGRGFYSSKIQNSCQGTACRSAREGNNSHENFDDDERVDVD